MQYCTICQKSIATIHILDLQDGAVSEQKHLCPGCAEKSGDVAPPTKFGPLKKLSTEILEDLVSGLKSPSEPSPGTQSPTCPACGLTAEDFRMRGRLGCPRCYETLRDSLISLLERVHDGKTHVGRYPGRTANTEPDNLTDLHRRLADAIRDENYEDAARLRDELRELKP